jgi:hypothetical protein
MITADKLRNIKPTSTYESRLEKAVKRDIKSNKRFMKRRLIKNQKQNERSYQFGIEVSDEFKTQDYREAYEKYYKNLGFTVKSTGSYVHNMFYITLYW